jgi:putative membrane protein
VRILKLLYFVLGVALLAVVVGETNLDEVLSLVLKIGWGLLAIVAIYFAAFAIDSFTWLMAMPSQPMNAVWTFRTWAVRMVGEAFNNVIPAASMGGEPVKAVLLKKHYGVGYREAAASLILAKTINMVSLCLFLVIGFGLVIASEVLTPSAKGVAAVGLFTIVLSTYLFFAVQRYRMTSLTGTWLSRQRFAGRINDVLHHIHDMDERLVAFYTQYRGRMFWAVMLAFANWVLGAVEVYYAMMFLGHPVSWMDAWIIESVAQMVRTGTFFIPASIGAQEGAFLVISGAITGSPSLGLAVGIVRRIREVIWIACGFAFGAVYSLRSEAVD